MIVGRGHGAMVIYSCPRDSRCNGHLLAFFVRVGGLSCLRDSWAHGHLLAVFVIVGGPSCLRDSWAWPWCLVISAVFVIVACGELPTP